MSKYPRKFYFTQFSAPLVGFSGLFLLLGTARHFGWLTDYHSVSQIIPFVFILVLGLVGSMFLWGRLLVVAGILTKEEAKGYPYSKPWDKTIQRDT